MEKIKCFEISPKSVCGFKYDSYIVKDTGSWSDLSYHIEDCLETQFLQECNTWKDIGLKIDCIELTQEEFDDLKNDE